MRSPWNLVFGSWSLVFGSWFLVLCSWNLVFGSWSLVFGSCSLPHTLIRRPIDDRPAKRYFVGIFQFVAEGDAAGYGADVDGEGAEFFVEEEARCVALDGGGQRKDDLFADARGEAIEQGDDV